MRRLGIALVTVGLLAGGCSTSESSPSQEPVTTELETQSTDPANCAELNIGVIGCDAEVEYLQITLNDLNCDAGPAKGGYGPKTANGVEEFQKFNELREDGFAGEITLGVLYSDEKKPCVPIEESTTTTVAAPETTITSEVVVDETTTTMTVVPETTVATTTTAVEPQGLTGDAAIQEHSDTILSQFGFPELSIDGDYGSLTERSVCTSRFILGLAHTREHITYESDAGQAFINSNDIVLPPEVNSGQEKSVIISKTCQTMIAVDNGSIFAIWPTSTGENGHKTRDTDDAVTFHRPAVENGGWHNSTDFPVAIDNPLNGNMYKPLYFNGGQAIHGANNVPPTPQSKGCARLTPRDQDALLSWIDMQGATKDVWGEDSIGLDVLALGDFEDGI